ncbi:MAG TPA: hypothetical protein VFO05_12650 [Candidatus Limnocylindrales bacterium]|nr:hypothetical protein [Candidatus Limnocylindrales bacterium]
MRRRTGALALVAVLIALAAATAPATLARLTDQDGATLTLSTDTLAPPTGLTATGPLTASLAWTASSDAYAAGYQVLRSATSGSGYALVGTVTPGSATATTDTPGTGTFYYVLLTYFQSWLSVESNQASVTIGQTSTGFLGCAGASNAADTGGDGNGYDSGPANACADGGAVATDTSTGTNTTLSCADAGKDRHRFWDFSLGVPAVVSSVDGITVRADVGLNNNSGTSTLCVQLSWDGGSTWTAFKTVGVTAVGETTYTLGGAADDWGRTWTGGQLSNADFRVRLVDVSDRTNKDFRLDYLAVDVTYSP